MADYLPNGYPARHLYEPLADYPRRAGKMMRPHLHCNGAGVWRRPDGRGALGGRH